MVLEDSTTDPATLDPLSDPDPYGDSEYSTKPGGPLPSYHIDNVPQANFLMGALSGVNNARISSACSSHLQNAAQLLHRNPTQAEAEALTQHCAAGLVTASYGKPLGYAAGLYRAYSTRKTYRFPFRTPPKTFDPSRLTIFGITVFEGQQARVMWHGLRGCAYFVGIGYLAHFLFGVSGMWKMTVGEATDPRLKEYTKAQREFVKNARSSEAMERMKRAGSVDNKDAGEVLRRGRERQVERRPRRGVETREPASPSDWDDASPSAAGWDETGSDPMAEDSSLSSTPTPDAYSRKRTPVQRQESGNTRYRVKPQAEQEQHATSADALLSDLGTPSSDTSSGQSPSSNNGSSGESVWARIRRESTSSDSDSGSS